jgi:hypothetical protein
LGSTPLISANPKSRRHLRFSSRDTIRSRSDRWGNGPKRTHGQK